MRRGTAILVGTICLCGLAGPGSGPASAEQASARRTPIVRAVERVAPATVNITSTQRIERRGNPFLRGDPFFDEFFERFLDPDPGPSETLGTGTILDPNGLVLTNEHVLAGAREIRVTLLDGREFAAELVGADPETDLAVVRIQSKEPLPAAPLGRAADLMMGETVIAIGNPYGLNHTVTTGVLSAVNRSFRAGESEYHGFLQTDASINPGNSGGPLLNLDGEVIGINTAIFRDAQGIGFAIPIDRAKRIMDDLIRDGAVTPVWLGLRLQEITPKMRSALGVRAQGGALVAHVFPGSAAERGGLQRGDVILALDGSRVQSPLNYFEILRGVTQGDTVVGRIEREGRSFERQLVAEVFADRDADQLAALMLGIEVEAARRSDGASAVRIAKVLPGGPAAGVRLAPGDLILAIDRQSLSDRASFRNAISRLQGRSRTLLFVQRGIHTARVALVVS
jgi:Do/DeqQ family serine protease